MTGKTEDRTTIHSKAIGMEAAAYAADCESRVRTRRARPGVAGLTNSEEAKVALIVPE